MMLVGRQLLANRYHNKGTAFTSEERDRYRLNGLLPPVVEDLDTQMQRVRAEFDAAHGDLARHIFLRALQANNSVLFYRFLVDNLEELLPIVYTPTVGLACQAVVAHVSARARPVRVVAGSASHPRTARQRAVARRRDTAVSTSSSSPMASASSASAISAWAAWASPSASSRCTQRSAASTPNERFPCSSTSARRTRSCCRIRSTSAGGIGVCATTTTTKWSLAFVDALRARCPGVLLQWEDFAQRNANRLLHAHRDRICSFNDDIQGTAAVGVAAIVGGMRIVRDPLADLRVVIAGAGSAGIGIARQATSALVSAGLTVDEARGRCWLVDRDGLLHDRLDGLQEFQAEFVRPWESVAELADGEGRVSLLAVVGAVAPHALVGVTGQPGLFTEAVIRAQAREGHPPDRAARCRTRRAAPSAFLPRCWRGPKAAPWSALAVRSPWPPSARTRTRSPRSTTSICSRVSAAESLRSAPVASATRCSVPRRPPSDPSHLETRQRPLTLLPPLTQVGDVADAVALAVARQAVDEGLAAHLDDEQIVEAVEAHKWRPQYRQATSQAG